MAISARRERFRKVAIKSAFFVGLFMPEIVLAQNLNCRAECANNTPFCLAIPTLVAGPNIPWALRNLHGYVDKRFPAMRIKPGHMLGFFGMTRDEDPCGRGDTVVESGRVKNQGAASCRVSVYAPNLSGQVDIRLGFDVPLQVEGKIERNNDTIEVDFSTSPAAAVPQFWIDNQFLNADWGGKIKRFSFGPQETIVSTENGCLKYAY